MSDYTAQRLISNIINNFNFAKNDFVGISIFNMDILIFLKSGIFVVLLFVVLYLLGDRFRLKFFKQIELGDIEFFVNIALGYILVGTAIAMLGFLSILYFWSLSVFFIAVIIFSLYPLASLKKRMGKIKYVFKEYIKIFKEHKLINIAIIGFVLIGFLRLIPPETGVDALWYHTDYPRLYLKTHSFMNVDPRGNFYPIVTPGLGEMYYLITQFVGLKDSSRAIHFVFYLLVALFYIVGFKKNKFPFYLYAGLLFVTSPVVIRHTSTAYTEFQWILCWLVAIIIILRKKNSTYEVALSGLLFGGALATKLWMLPFSAVFIAYFFLTYQKFGLLKTFKIISAFMFFSMLVPLLWYLRAYIITGNPLFPAFWTFPNGGFNIPLDISAGLFTLESLKKRGLNLLNLSPFSIAGLLFLFTYSLKKIEIKNKRIIIFCIILSAVQFLVSYNWHRFLIPFYSVIVLALGVGIVRLFSKYASFSPIFFAAVFIMFLYYFLNTIMILPYGFGWADKNKYLTRILSKDNSSYYDYGERFSKFITKNDTVATYGLWGFYYGDFNYVYLEDLFRKKGKSFDLIKNSATKLLIKGGDIDWLCKKEDLIGCSPKKYIFLTSYMFPYHPASQYLYKLSK